MDIIGVDIGPVGQPGSPGEIGPRGFKGVEGLLGELTSSIYKIRILQQALRFRTRLFNQVNFIKNYKCNKIQFKLDVLNICNANDSENLR